MNPLQKKVIIGLQTRKGYPHRISEIKLEETHISWIFLTGSYAYKIKKELKFGTVLDFSTLELRKRYCQKEARLNKILCKDMYKGVVKIIQESDSNCDDKDNDGSENSTYNIRITGLRHKGKAIEYAVKMLEFPQKFRMDNLISLNMINLEIVEKVAESLVRFHLNTPTSKKIRSYGRPQFVKRKIDENFRTLEKLERVDPKFEVRLIEFVKKNRNLFYQRIKEDKVRDIHGDLYLKNIFIVKNRIYMYDRLEFNDSLRYADVAEDVAHLSMDFDHHSRSDLRKWFVSKYIEKTNDTNLERTIYFWMCYKACVRAKVSIYHAKSEMVPEKRTDHINESRGLFTLAETYIDRF